MSYEKEYSRTGALFGMEPAACLKSFAGKLEPGARVLDIGAGQGRNAFFLAGRGVRVHALEPSEAGAASIRRRAAEEDLPVEVFTALFEEFSPPAGAYDGVMAFGVMPDLRWSSIRALVERMARWSRPGAVLWLVGFTTEDPAHASIRESWKALGEGSYESPEGRIRTYLRPGRILELFEGCSVLHHWEGIGPVHRHGGGAPERHGLFEAVLQRPADGGDK